MFAPWGLPDFLHPGQRQADFEIGDDEMEVGVGIHGEPGRRRDQMKPADGIVDEVYKAVRDDLPFKREIRLPDPSTAWAAPQFPSSISSTGLQPCAARKTGWKFSVAMSATTVHPWKWPVSP